MVMFPTPPTDSPAQRIVEILLRQGPRTVTELAHALGVTATAVRQQLNRLVTEGWLLRTHRNSGPGRPAGVYGVSEKARRACGAGGPDLSRLLIDEIVRTDGESKARDILERVSRRFANAARPSVGDGPPGERVQRLADYLSREGVVAESQPRGLRLSVFTCPYGELAQEHRELCEMEREAFSELVARPVHQHQCMLDGHAACEFSVASAAEAPESPTDAGPNQPENSVSSADAAPGAEPIDRRQALD